MVTFAVIGAVLSSGARNRFTRLVGTGRIREAQGVFSLSMILSVGCAVLLMLLMLLYYVALVEIENRRLGTRRKGLFNRILLQPDSFDVPEEDMLDISVTSMDEVVAVSRAVRDFCDAHGCDSRRRFLLSLAVEEMAGNVIEHGFSKDKKHHSIDLRVMNKGDDYLLRIRDDCLIFDPVKQLELFSDADPTHHMGLRMIFGTAKEVQYTSILKLNNLLIKI